MLPEELPINLAGLVDGGAEFLCALAKGGLVLPFTLAAVADAFTTGVDELLDLVEASEPVFR